jgi:two-component system cell cycle response regulator DivK
MTKMVLIVEDNDLNLRLFEDILAAEGIATLSATSGAVVADMAREQRPDLILMDIQLPEISGLEATHRVQRSEETAGNPIIAITAHALPGDERRIRAGGCTDYVAKPVLIDTLVSIVKRHLN